MSSTYCIECDVHVLLLHRLQLPFANQLPPAPAVEEDDYDADVDAALAPILQFPVPSAAAAVSAAAAATASTLAAAPLPVAAPAPVMAPASAVVPESAAAAATAATGFGTLPQLGLAPPSLPPLQVCAERPGLLCFLGISGVHLPYCKNLHDFEGGCPAQNCQFKFMQCWLTGQRVALIFLGASEHRRGTASCKETIMSSMQVNREDCDGVA